MIKTDTYLKNSNTGEVVMKREYSETRINFPVVFFDLDGKELEDNMSTKGFVEISEKKWNVLKRKSKKS